MTAALKRNPKVWHDQNVKKKTSHTLQVLTSSEFHLKHSLARLIAKATFKITFPLSSFRGQ